MQGFSSRPIGASYQPQVSLAASGAAATVAVLEGVATVGVQITGTWNATLQFEGTVDKTNWFAVNAYAVNSGVAATSTTANGQWQVNAGGISQVRVRVSAYTSGTAVVSLVGDTAPIGAQPGGAVSLAPTTAGGLTLSRTISAATTNATSVKASAGQLYFVHASNVNAAARYLKLYNKASAPTVGSDTPVMTLLIPPNSSGFIVDISSGIAFSTGIAFAITGAVTDADTTAVSLNEHVIHLGYK